MSYELLITSSDLARIGIMEARPNTRRAREYRELVAQILLPITIGRQISTLFRSSNNHNIFILTIIN